MSRSYKKHCYSYFATCNSQKEWKRLVNREIRRGARQLLQSKSENEDLLFPTIDEIGNVYSSPADGTKHYTPYLEKASWYGTYNEYFLEILRK